MNTRNCVVAARQARGYDSSAMADAGPKFSPGDLYIGVLDFFAILLPGVIAVAFAFYEWPPHSIPFQTWQWVALLVAGYIVGHLLHALGGLILDPLLYDRLFKPTPNLQDCPLIKDAKPGALTKYRHDNCKLFAYARKLIEESDCYREGKPERLLASEPLKQETYSGEMLSGPVGPYKWARAWLRLHNQEATAELERLEADSKLFRSLGILVPVGIVVAFIAHTSVTWRITIATVGISTLLLVLWRYCDLRQKSVRMCYLYFVQLYSAREVNQRRFAKVAGQSFPPSG